LVELAITNLRFRFPTAFESLHARPIGGYAKCSACTRQVVCVLDGPDPDGLALCFPHAEDALARVEPPADFVERRT
jgi:hypothetical protein